METVSRHTFVTESGCHGNEDAVFHPFLSALQLPKFSTFTFHIWCIGTHWRLCVATYDRHLMWLPWQPGCCFPSVPVRTLTPKVFNFNVSYLVHRYRLWRRCVVTSVRHLKWLPCQPGCCFPCSSTILYIPSCSGVYCAHLRSCY